MDLKCHLAYYGKAAAHTFWEAFVASLMAALSGSGMGLEHLPQLPVIQKVALSAVIAGLAAVLSYFKQLLVLPSPGSVTAREA